MRHMWHNNNTDTIIIFYIFDIIIKYCLRLVFFLLLNSTHHTHTHICPTVPSAFRVSDFFYYIQMAWFVSNASSFVMKTKLIPYKLFIDLECGTWNGTVRMLIFSNVIFCCCWTWVKWNFVHCSNYSLFILFVKLFGSEKLWQ